MAVEQSRAEVFARNLQRELDVRGMTWTDLTRGDEAGWDPATRLHPETVAKIRAYEEVTPTVRGKIARRLTARPVDEMLLSLFEPAAGSS